MLFINFQPRRPIIFISLQGDVPGHTKSLSRCALGIAFPVPAARLFPSCGRTMKYRFYTRWREGAGKSWHPRGSNPQWLNACEYLPGVSSRRRRHRRAICSVGMHALRAWSDAVFRPRRIPLQSDEKSGEPCRTGVSPQRAAALPGRLHRHADASVRDSQSPAHDADECSRRYFCRPTPDSAAQ